MRIISQDKTMDINYDNYSVYVRGEPDHNCFIYADNDYNWHEGSALCLAGPMSYESAKRMLKKIRDTYHLGQKYYELDY